MSTEERRRRARAKAPTEALRIKSALQLRIEGMTYAQIGEELGISMQAAHQSIKASLERVAADRRDLSRLVLDLELERTEFVLRSLATRVEAGDHNAANSYLRALERRAKLLGIDAPDKHEHSGLPADPTVIHARLGAIAARAARGVDADAAGDAERDGTG